MIGLGSLLLLSLLDAVTTFCGHKVMRIFPGFAVDTLTHPIYVDQQPLTGCELLLSENHLQLAAQAPNQWGRTPQSMASTRLAIRKAAWRALIQNALFQARIVPSVDNRRLGRVNDSAYNDWPSFLTAAGQKFGVDLSGTPRDFIAEKRVEIFQFLRCILGPVVESFLMLDRKMWLKRELKVCLFHL